MSAFQRIGLIAKTNTPAVADVVTQLISHLDAVGLTTLLHRDSAQRLAPEREALPLAELATRIDLAVVVGGDGTLLHAGRRLAPFGVPILGVNQGRLGFMVDVLPDDFVTAIGHVMSGACKIDERLILQASIADESPVDCMAINDVVVRSSEQVRMLDFSTWADGQLISHHRADGIIISTATGSTAYALSAGGPMLHPSLDAVGLVPISPHTLSDRPLILHSDSVIEVRVHGPSDCEALFSCDGQIHNPLPVGASLEIRHSPHRLRLVHPPDYDYFSILRDKLHWGSATEPGRVRR